MKPPYAHHRWSDKSIFSQALRKCDRRAIVLCGGQVGMVAPTDAAKRLGGPLHGVWGGGLALRFRLLALFWASWHPQSSWASCVIQRSLHEDGSVIPSIFTILYCDFQIVKTIPRHAVSSLQSLSDDYPILAITGQHQSGKTTLAQSTFPDKPYVSLQDLDNLAYAQEDPRGFLARFASGAILDEVQRCPALFSYLQTRVDETQCVG